MANVMLNGEEYPIKCDIDVLMEIQEKYNTFLNFEMKIAGYEAVKNDDGTAKLGNDNKPVIVLRDPSLRAIYDILPLMLKAGAEDGDEVPKLSKTDLEFDIRETANAMYEAFRKGFERKNLPSAKGAKKAKTNK